MNLLKILGLIDVPRMDKFMNLLTLGLIFFMIIFTICYYSILPEKIPMHFDLNGNINRYGDKSSIFILPLITFVMGIGLLILSNFPQTFNYNVPITESNKKEHYALASSMMRQMTVFITFCLSIIVLIICLIASEKISSSAFGLWFTFILIGGLAWIIIRYVIKSKQIS